VTAIRSVREQFRFPELLALSSVFGVALVAH
jgi:hypothetical protein